MRMLIGFMFASLILLAMNSSAFEQDTINTSDGNLVITFVGHGTLMMEYDGKVIHIDPVGQYADYSKMPKADIILVTHAHGDHLDINAIETLKTPSTKVILAPVCAEKYKNGIILKNGDSKTVDGLQIKAVPAYNIKHMRSPGNPYHPKGEGNGYVIRFADKSVYVAGDTENIPEMASLKNIDIAFLPMNLPYTMTPEMVADAVQKFHPDILYPYHFGNTDTGKLTALLKNSDTEVRIRKME